MLTFIFYNDIKKLVLKIQNRESIFSYIKAPSYK